MSNPVQPSSMWSHTGSPSVHVPAVRLSESHPSKNLLIQITHLYNHFKFELTLLPDQVIACSFPAQRIAVGRTLCHEMLTPWRPLKHPKLHKPFKIEGVEIGAPKPLNEEETLGWARVVAYQTMIWRNGGRDECQCDYHPSDPRDCSLKGFDYTAQMAAASSTAVTHVWKGWSSWHCK